MYRGGYRHCTLKDTEDVIKIAENDENTILIIRNYDDSIKESILSSNIKIIYWCHNFVRSDFCNFASRTAQVKAVVFVGKQMYDMYIDDDVIKKSTFIYNEYPETCTSTRNNDCKTVVYIGAIIRGKGFLQLCRIWKGILREVPDARLLVLGSGTLYGSSKLGKYGIAADEYEREFIPYITDSDGNLLKSIKFLGNVGAEKQQIFLQSSVGVINPSTSTSTETFGLGIVEMNDASLPVVTYIKPGYIDTIVNGETGIMSSSLEDLQYQIIRLLKDPQENKRLGENGKMFIRRFSPDVILPQWLDLLSRVAVDVFKPSSLKATRPYTKYFKWARMFNCELRFRLGLRFLPSFVKCFDIVRSIFRK